MELFRRIFLILATAAIMFNALSIVLENNFQTTVVRLLIIVLLMLSMIFVELSHR